MRLLVNAGLTVEERVMVKLPTIAPSLPILDSRTCKPPPKVADAELQTSAHRAWRRVVLVKAGFRCEAIEGDGTRCQAHAPRDRLFADHIIERSDGGAALDPDNGQCLCGKHHTAKTIDARARRHGLAPR
jgi:5-methylcytosine-specific restriction enzyme A